MKSIINVQSSQTAESKYQSETISGNELKKFKVLRGNEYMMICLGIFSKESNRSSKQLFKSPATCFFLFNILMMLVGSSALYIYNHPFELRSVLEGGQCVIGGLQLTGMFINTALKTKTITKLHNKLQLFVDQGKLIFFVFSREN